MNGPNKAPYAQKLDIGWVIVGDVCLGNARKPKEISTVKTCILENGHPTCFTPCDSHLMVEDNYNLRGNQRIIPEELQQITPVKATTEESFAEAVFCQSRNDNQLAPSIEDKTFFEMMEKKFAKDDKNKWVVLLPFRNPRLLLPNKRDYAYMRVMSLRRTLDMKPNSFPTEAEAVDVLQRARIALALSNIKLHKIASVTCDSVYTSLLIFLGVFFFVFSLPLLYLSV